MSFPCRYVSSFRSLYIAIAEVASIDKTGFVQIGSSMFRDRKNASFGPGAFCVYDSVEILQSIVCSLYISFKKNIQLTDWGMWRDLQMWDPRGNAAELVDAIRRRA